jgi:hypothetical protein
MAKYETSLLNQSLNLAAALGLSNH